MNGSPHAQLAEDARKLDELNRSVIKAVVEWNTDEICKSLREYLNLKKQVKVASMDSAVAQIHDPDARNVLQKISSGEAFEADEILHSLVSGSDQPMSLNELDDDEREKLSCELFHPWFGAWDYIDGLYDIGSLIVGIPIPDSLTSYVSEARQCYAFQQYNAVCALCRTILEVTIRDICERKGLFPERDQKVISYERDVSIKVAPLIKAVSKGKLKKRVESLYYGSSIP